MVDSLIVGIVDHFSDESPKDVVQNLQDQIEIGRKMNTVKVDE